jgi:hypothetical protein
MTTHTTGTREDWPAPRAESSHSLPARPPSLPRAVGAQRRKAGVADCGVSHRMWGDSTNVTGVIGIVAIDVKARAGSGVRPLKRTESRPGFDRPLGVLLLELD